MRSLLFVGLLASVLQADPVTLTFDVDFSNTRRTYTEGGMTITNGRSQYCDEQDFAEYPNLFHPYCSVSVGGGVLNVAAYIAIGSRALNFDMGGQAFNLISVHILWSFAGSVFSLPDGTIPPGGGIYPSPENLGTTWNGYDLETPYTHYFTDPAWQGITGFTWTGDIMMTIDALTFEPVTGTVPEPSSLVLFSLAGVFLIGGTAVHRRRNPK